MKVCPACSLEYGDEHDICRDDGATLVHLDTGAGDVAQDLIGQVVDGRYRIEHIVGRGGMGTIYACRHVVVGKAFAIKVLRAGIERSEETLQRFIREAQAANAVHSRHICAMSDFGQLPSGAFYVVMDLLEGVSLTRALREKQLIRKDIKHIFVQIADTLEQAHRAHIIHRDLKPDNVVLVCEDDDPHFVKLVDFGIAKMLEHGTSNLTETGVILGTPYYMSPEQARGDPVDHRSDIYALGVMMYRAFTGKLPFVADTAMGVLTRHLTEKPELPSRLAEVDPPLERLILRCLEKKPIDRFQSMAEVAAALASIEDLLPSRSRHDATVDDRSGAIAVVVPDAGAASSGVAGSEGQVPTRVATPGGHQAPGLALEPALRQAAAVQPATAAAAMVSPAQAADEPPTMPPPLPTPTPTAAAVAMADAGSGGLSPAGRAPGTATPLGLVPGEAATHRGLVSSQLDTPRPPITARRAALWIGVSALMALVGAGAALALFTPHTPRPARAESPAAGTTSAATSETSSSTSVTAVAEPPSAVTSASASADSSAQPAASASASSTQPGRRHHHVPAHPPHVPDRPPPEIRSPFD